MSRFYRRPFIGTQNRVNAFRNPQMLVQSGMIGGTSGSTAATMLWSTGLGSVLSTGVTTALTYRLDAAALGSVWLVTADAYKVDVTPGTAYKFRTAVRMDLGGVTTGTKNAYATINWRDAANASLGVDSVGSSVTLTDAGSGASPWMWVDVAGTAPAGGVIASLQVTVNLGMPSGGSIATTCWMFTRSADMTYFDGDTTPTDTLQYQWSIGKGSSQAGEYIPNPAVDEVAPLFGPTSPTEYKRKSANLTHRLLDVPSSMWVTSRPSEPRSGVWKMIFDTAQAASKAVDYLSVGTWRYDSELALAYLDVARFTVPDGEEVTMTQAQVVSSDRSEWKWVVTCPWQEVNS